MRTKVISFLLAFTQGVPFCQCGDMYHDKTKREGWRGFTWTKTQGWLNQELPQKFEMDGPMELSPGMEVWKGNQDQMELSMGPGASVCLYLSYIHTLIALFHKKAWF